MDRDLFNIDTEPLPVEDHEEIVLEYEFDGIETRDETELDGEVQTDATDGPDQQVEDPWVSVDGVDDAIDCFVELMMARDLDSLEDMLAPEVEASLLGEVSRPGVLEGLADLLLRYPDLVLTRGDLGLEPIAAAWVFDQEQNRYDMVGYFAVEMTDGDDPKIERLDFVEEPADPDELLVEIPDRSELPRVGRLGDPGRGLSPASGKDGDSSRPVRPQPARPGFECRIRTAGSQARSTASRCRSSGVNGSRNSASPTEPYSTCNQTTSSR